MQFVTEPSRQSSTKATASQPPSKREAILQAALEVFAEQGFHGSPVPPIAERAGVGVGTIYRHFTDKDALVNEVFRLAKSSLRQTLLQDLDPTRPLKDVFDQFWARLIGFARQHPQAFHFLEMHNHLPYLDQQSKQVELEVLEPIMAVLAQHRESGELATRLRIEPLIAMIWGGVVGLFKYEKAAYYELTDEDFQAACDTIWMAISGSAISAHP